jgi:hypothetical protein
MEVEFYNNFMILKKEKEDIQREMNLSDNQYLNLVKHAKRMEKPTITTDFLESLIVQKLHQNPNDKDVWKQALEIWKFKHKIPNESKSDDKINLNELLGDTIEETS